MKGAASHGIGLRSTRLRWARLTCFVLGHEEWRDVEGSWFCMRCLKTNDLELTWVHHRFGPDSTDETLLHAFRATVRKRSNQLAATRPAERKSSEKGDGPL